MIKKAPVIFLDRDGTLNEEVHYLYKPEDLHILPGVPEALRRFREAGYQLVVVTNQSGIARGYYTEADVVRLHQYLNERLGESQASIDAFYICPHHPEYGGRPQQLESRGNLQQPGYSAHPQQLKSGREPHPPEYGSYSYQTECRCRKPGIGMFEQAAADFPIDLERSWMIGDKAIDTQAGRAFGLKTVLVGTGYGTAQRQEADYDIFAETLMDAAAAIVSGAALEGN